MRSRGLLVAGGALVGVALGWLLVQRHQARHRQDLFSSRPLRRFAALGALAGEGGVETARLLRDYLAWETQPVLRQRGQALLRRVELNLG